MKHQVPISLSWTETCSSEFMTLWFLAVGLFGSDFACLFTIEIKIDRKESLEDAGSIKIAFQRTQLTQGTRSIMLFSKSLQRLVNQGISVTSLRNLIRSSAISLNASTSMRYEAGCSKYAPHADLSRTKLMKRRKLWISLKHQLPSDLDLPLI